MDGDKNKLSGLRVAVLVTDGYEEAELIKPREALEAAGAKTVIIAPKSGKVQGMNHADKAGTASTDLTMKEADPAEFDAVLLPGGALNADALRMNSDAQKFIKAIDADRKPIAVICHGSWLLVSSGLARGRTLTSYSTIQDDIRNAGGTWVDQEVARDSNWVSSRQPTDIPAFNREMLALFAEPRRKAAKGNR